MKKSCKDKFYIGKLPYILCFIIPLIFLCGCSSVRKDEILLEHNMSEDEMSDKTIITFFGHKADSLNLIAIEKSLGEFMDRNEDIYVTYEGVKGTDYWKAFELRAKTGNLDDIVMLDHERIQELSEEGGLVDLSGLSTLDNYIPWTRKQFTNKDGTVYFLPTCIATYNLFINKDLLEEHGQKIPSDLREFTQVCDYFAGRGITPIIANNYGSLPTLVIAKGMYDIYSAEDYTVEIEKFNSGEADFAKQLCPGVEFVSSMLERGWLDADEVLNTAQTSDDLMLFSKGERPFMISGGWASVRLDVDFSYGVYPYPIMEDGSVMAAGVDTCIGINAKSENIEEAVRLLEFLTQPDVMWEYCDSQCSYSPLTDRRIPSDETIAPSVAYLTNGRMVLRSDYNLEFSPEAALRECCNQLMKGMDTDSVMKMLSEMLYPEQGGSL